MPIKEHFQQKLSPKEHFTPTFCPNPHCSNYAKPPKTLNWCKKIGNFTRKDGEKIPRWICLQDDKPHSFSYASFECTYWLKHRNLLPDIAQKVSEQCSLRGIARSLKVSQNCIHSQLMRIGRHCLLLNEWSRKSINPNKLSTLVFDELESWEVSQFVPTTHPLFMDTGSGFKLEAICTPIRRKGRMTELQVEEYEKWKGKYPLASQQSARMAVKSVLQHLKSLYQSKDTVEVATDEKSMYSTLLRKEWKGIKYVHKQYSSKEGRNVGYMGKINQEDQYIRQRCATMRRESLDFMRRHNNTTLRHQIYMLKRNFVQARSGTKRKSNPAVRLELIDEPVDWLQVFSKRVLGGLSQLPKYLQRSYFQQNKTSFFNSNYEHKSVYAI